MTTIKENQLALALQILDNLESHLSIKARKHKRNSGSKGNKE